MPLDDLIEYMVWVVRTEISEMANEALAAVDRKLGFSESFINRARAQRRRHARERATKEKA